MLAELALSIFIFGRSIEAHFAAYATDAGVIGLLAQLALGACPLIQLKTDVR